MQSHAHPQPNRDSDIFTALGLSRYKWNSGSGICCLLTTQTEICYRYGQYKTAPTVLRMPNVRMPLPRTDLRPRRWALFLRLLYF